MDITRWSTPKSDWLYSLQPKMEKLYRANKNKTRSWKWLRSWTPYYQIQTNLDSIFKSRDITLPTKVSLVKGMVFPVVMYGCESWIVKKAERRRIDAFELWCWRRLLRVLWDCKENQSVHSKGGQPWDFFGRNDAKAETPVLWSPHAKSWLIGKDSDAGRDWGQEEKGTTEDEMAGCHRWLDGRWVWVNSRSWWWTGRPGMLQFMASQRVGHD